MYKPEANSGWDSRVPSISGVSHEMAKHFRLRMNRIIQMPGESAGGIKFED